MPQSPAITGHVFIASSLDGYIARSDGNLDWLMKQPVQGEDHGYDAFIAGMDGIIMGRGSFEKVLTFPDWPYDKPVVVMSQTLDPDTLPEHLTDRVRIARATPERLMQALADEGWSHAYIDGGQVIQSFLRAGLIESLTVTRVPILLGRGKPLFGGLERDIDLDLMETRVFASGLMSSRYEIRKG